MKVLTAVILYVREYTLLKTGNAVPDNLLNTLTTRSRLMLKFDSVAKMAEAFSEIYPGVRSESEASRVGHIRTNDEAQMIEFWTRMKPAFSSE